MVGQWTAGLVVSNEGEVVLLEERRVLVAKVFGFVLVLVGVVIDRRGLLVVALMVVVVVAAVVVEFEKIGLTVDEVVKLL